MAINFARESKLSKSSGRLKGNGGVVIMAFVTVLLAIAILSPTADQTNLATTSSVVTNFTVTLPTTAGSTVELPGRDFLSSSFIINRTNASQDWSGNITLSDGFGADGTKTVLLTLNGVTSSTTIGGNAFINGSDVNLTYSANPDGFVGGASATILRLVIIFGALAVLGYLIRSFYVKGYFDGLLNR